jgi:hypothetical protein
VIRVSNMPIDTSEANAFEVVIARVQSQDPGTVFHFSCAGPGEDPQGLLRVVADHLDEIGPVQVADIMFRLIAHEDGVRSLSEMTVYYDRPNAA